MVQTLKRIASRDLIEQQLTKLNNRNNKKHRIVYPGHPLSCLDAVYFCRLKELVAETWLMHQIEVDENAIVVQEAESSDDENENVTLAAQWAYNTRHDVLEQLRHLHIGVLNSGTLNGYPDNTIGINFNIERRWFKPCGPKRWSQRFLQLARLMARLAQVAKRNSIKFTDADTHSVYDVEGKPGIYLSVQQRNGDNVVRELSFYPEWKS